ncbi:hypothetical protein C923_01606 [Plasmodium falciparum UGT5.1]|uniref:Growth arrest-specific protein 8 domain-containing protein n=1 Tax=Plasmodium falciparum UGT5.1 TaxID=1237627 RepID=W7JFN5_PLAFA|nr:hypothetical protein C923_01606 [Plasmodium falciparum UGT5.1]
MKDSKKKGSSKKREEKLMLIKELNKINDEINVEQNNVEDLSVKIKNIDGQIFLGYHDIKEEKLTKKKNYFSKRKGLEQLKKNISIQRKILEGVERDAYELERNIVDYENLRNDLKKIKEKRKKQQKILHELKLETDVKKMLLTKISNEYKTIYDQNKMKLYDYLQKLLLENYFLETKMKLKNESLEVNTIELNKWKESNNPENNEILNNTLNEKFQDFNILKNEIEELIDVNEKNHENYKAIMHLNYFNNEDLDILKREEQINII